MIKGKSGPRAPKCMKAKPLGWKIFKKENFLERGPNLGINNLVMGVSMNSKEGG